MRDALVRFFAAATVAVACGAPATAGAQHLFKCGNAFQDRPCESADVQQRFSHTAGKFSVQQVNADTDKDCADAAGSVMPFWQRMKGGETVEQLRAEMDAQPVSREEKSRRRDLLLTLKEFKGTPTEVRSDLERTCMNYKRAKGLPTETDATAKAKSRSSTYDSHSIQNQARRLEAENRAAERQADWDAQMARARAAAAARAASGR
jgi:hypothetical protein